MVYLENFTGISSVFAIPYFIVTDIVYKWQVIPKKRRGKPVGKSGRFCAKKDGRSHLVKREQPSAGLILWHGT